MSRIVKFCAAALLLSVLAGCSSGGGPALAPAPLTGGEPTPNSEKIDPGAVVPETFANCDAYLGYLAGAFLESLTKDQPCGFGWCRLGLADFNAPPPAPAAPLAGVEPAVPGDVSQTNTQEPGIDEGDRVEADSAGYLYILNGQRLVIADGFPVGQTAIVAEVDFPGTDWPQELLLDEASQRLLVLGVGYVADPAPGKSVTVIRVLDVSDPAAPVVSATLQLDGFLLASRRIGSRVHAFTWQAMYLTDEFYADGGWDLVQNYRAAASTNVDTAVAAAALRQAITSAITQSVDGYLPAVIDATGATDTLGCGDIAAPAVAVDPAVTILASFDTDGANLDTSALVTNFASVYVAEDNAYLAQSSRDWWWDPAQADETAIYKYAIGAGAPQYRATGVVGGQVYNNLHLSEYDGRLRVATNQIVFDTGSSNFDSSNHLYVLDDNGAGALDITGSINGFGQGEDIFAVRFAGADGYVVTFRQIDPLFTFDLSDPFSPRLAGELELPGFSTYMQSLDDDHLLTIGRAGTDSGNIGPLALRIFDVSDLGAPRLDHTFVLEDSDLPWAGWSPASYDYRAFSYYAPRKLLALPYSFFGNGWQDSFNGFIYFSVDATAGIAEIGRINHNDLVDAALCGDAAGGCTTAAMWANVDPFRSVVMTDGDVSYIHTVSSAGGKVTTSDDPATVLGGFVMPAGN